MHSSILTMYVLVCFPALVVSTVPTQYVRIHDTTHAVGAHFLFIPELRTPVNYGEKAQAFRKKMVD